MRNLSIDAEMSNIYSSLLNFQKYVPATSIYVKGTVSNSVIWTPKVIKEQKEW